MKDEINAPIYFSPRRHMHVCKIRFNPPLLETASLVLPRIKLKINALICAWISNSPIQATYQAFALLISKKFGNGLHRTLDK